MVSRVNFQTGPQAEAGTGSNESARPAILVAFVFLSLTILAWPGTLQRIISLDWRLGNMRPVAYGVQAVLGALTLATVLRRRWVASKLCKLFPSKKQVSFVAATFVFSSALGLITAEGLLRLLHLPFQAKWIVSEDRLARFDRELGWSYIPNQSVTQTFGEEHRKVTMHFDEVGCRIRRPGDRAERSAPTVLFVGDSFTFGHGVTYEESFVGRLASMPDFPWQVVNLGVQGYGTDQALLLLKRQFKKFNTKAVVYTWPVSTGFDRNEMYDRRILHPRSLFLGTKPMFALKRDGTLYLAKTPAQYKDYSYSRLWACLQIFRVRWGPRPSARLTRALIKEMKDFVESNGANFIAVEWDQADPRQSEPLEEPWRPEVDVIRPAANPPPGWSTWIIPGDIHPDARAHLYVSELVAKELKRLMASDRAVGASTQLRSAE